MARGVCGAWMVFSRASCVIFLQVRRPCLNHVFWNVHKAKITIRPTNNDMINVITTFSYASLYLIKIYYGLATLNTLEMTIGMCKNLIALIRKDF